MNDCLEDGCVTCAYALIHKLLIWAHDCILPKQNLSSVRDRVSRVSREHSLGWCPQVYILGLNSFK